MTDLRLARLPFPLIALLTAGLLLGSCGDDDKKQEETPKEQTEAGLNDLEDFATDAARSTQGQLLQPRSHPASPSSGWLRAGALAHRPPGPASDRAPFASLTGFSPPPRPGLGMTGSRRARAAVLRLALADTRPAGWLSSLRHRRRHRNITARAIWRAIRFLDIIVDDAPPEDLDDIITGSGQLRSTYHP
jgi:hypothetical protein